jgi:hypothetical protein
VLQHAPAILDRQVLSTLDMLQEGPNGVVLLDEPRCSLRSYPPNAAYIIRCVPGKCLRGGGGGGGTK